MHRQLAGSNPVINVLDLNTSAPSIAHALGGGRSCFYITGTCLPCEPGWLRSLLAPAADVEQARAVPREEAPRYPYVLPSDLVATLP